MLDRVRVVPVHACGIAATLRPREVAALFDFKEGDPTHRVTKTLALASGPNGRYVVVHDFGAVVFFGWPKDEQEAFLAKLLATLPPEPHPPLRDDYLLEVRDDVEPKVGFDRTVVPVLNASTAEIVSLVLAQSVSMDYYEEDVRAAYTRVDLFATQLAVKGKIFLSEKQLNSFVGNVLATRNQIAMTLSLLDAPDLTWEREDFDRLYRALRNAFEIEDRYRTIQHKIELIQENLAIVVDLAQHRRSRALEWIVITLIAFEICLAIVEALFLRKH
jgi:uncharacterized Rmd1/YagE family protein